MKYNENFSILPIIAYTIPTFVLVYPSFFVNWLAVSMNLSYWQIFAIISTPFLGRIIGSFIYQKYNISLVVFSSLGLLVILQNFLNIILLIIVRFSIGILFGMLTAFAVDEAVRSRNSILIGLTTAGWSIGWLIAYILYTTVCNWHYITLSGMIIMTLSILNIGNTRNSMKFKNINIIKIMSPNFFNENDRSSKIALPSLKSILLYISSLTPAFILQIFPSILEKINLTWLILPSYIISILLYIILPIISDKFGIKNTIIISFVITLTCGLLTFIYTPYLLILFASFGLAILSLIPKYLFTRYEDSRRLGTALNISSIMGMIIPTLYGLVKISAEMILVI
ncbi:MAG: hypothetical protein QXY68_01905, partial [Saccharolobus sp.]